jgi:hypothetical protein
LCELFGINHGVDVAKLLEVGDYISNELKRDNLSRVKLQDFEEVAEYRKELTQEFKL